jgi:hypothetical protein
MSTQMDASTRWETEAIRASAAQRTNPPRPSSKRSSDERSAQPVPDGNKRWMTLKEAEAATNIPSNTIRKWVRKDGVDSYLESDGQMALRMVDLDSVLARAKKLGRTVAEAETTEPGATEPEAEKATEDGPRTADQESGPELAQPPGTMLVPIDAWNKMLNQLGNLHEAGQQLAEARERAAKAETESMFLRERLAEMRQMTSDLRPQTSDAEAVIGRETAKERTDDSGGSDPSDPGFNGGERAVASHGDGNEDRSDRSDSPDTEPTADVETAAYWRYLTTGWRDRKRRSRS